MAKWDWEEEEASGVPLSPSGTQDLPQDTPYQGSSTNGGMEGRAVFLSTWAFWRTIMIIITMIVIVRGEWYPLKGMSKGDLVCLGGDLVGV